jgi:hypothetical protein
MFSGRDTAVNWTSLEVAEVASAARNWADTSTAHFPRFRTIFGEVGSKPPNLQRWRQRQQEGGTLRAGGCPTSSSKTKCELREADLTDRSFGC